MTIYNLGSINIDHVYRLPHMAAPGETLAALSYAMGLGGKGANSAVAAAQAGSRVVHIGAIGPEGGWTRDALAGYGVDPAHIVTTTTPTGHAIIMVDAGAENAIILHPGANRTIGADQVALALADAGPGDTLMLQNETSAQVEAARMASDKGMRVIYSAAPFEAGAVAAVLPYVSILAMNEGEAAELAKAIPDVRADRIVTKGARGADWRSEGAAPLFAPAYAARLVDTTGAGDCFIGNVAAAMDAGLDRAAAMRRASAAAALQVSRPGAAAAMPTRDEVDRFLAR